MREALNGCDRAETGKALLGGRSELSEATADEIAERPMDADSNCFAPCPGQRNDGFPLGVRHHAGHLRFGWKDLEIVEARTLLAVSVQDVQLGVLPYLMPSMQPRSKRAAYKSSSNSPNSAIYALDP